MENFYESLKIYKLIFGSDENLSIANTFTNLGSVFGRLEMCCKALNNYNESLRIQRLIFGSDEHSSINSTLINIESVNYLMTQSLSLLLDFFNSIIIPLSLELGNS